MKFLFCALLIPMFLGWGCTHRSEQKTTLLDSLLYIPSETALARVYGAEHIQTIPNLHGNGQGTFALLFPGSSTQVLFRWNHKIKTPGKGLRSVRISLEHAVKSPPSNVTKWTTGIGAVPGMKLTELERLIGEFNLTVSKHDRKKIKAVYNHESDSIIYTFFFDPELKFTRRILKLDKHYSSKLTELQEEDPEIYAVELDKVFPETGRKQ